MARNHRQGTSLAGDQCPIKEKIREATFFGIKATLISKFATTWRIIILQIMSVFFSVCKIQLIRGDYLCLIKRISE